MYKGLYVLSAIYHCLGAWGLDRRAFLARIGSGNPTDATKCNPRYIPEFELWKRVCVTNERQRLTSTRASSFLQVIHGLTLENGAYKSGPRLIEYGPSGGTFHTRRDEKSARNEARGQANERMTE